MTTKTRQTLCAVAAIVSVLFTSSCSITGVTKGMEISKSAVAKIHDQYNAGQFRDIYAQADDEFRKATSENDYLAFVEAVHRKLGTVKQSDQTSWHVNATTFGTIVTLTYNVEFNEGKGTEQFVFRVSDEKAQLMNYNVDSRLLILK